MPEIKQILTSLIKTLVVSLTLSTAGYYLFKFPFIEGLIAVTILQVIIFYIWNTYVEYRLRITESIQITQRISEFSKQGIDAQCAHCSNINYIPVRFDEENIFKCETCGKPNSVYIDVTIAQSATGINKEFLSIGSYTKGKEDSIAATIGEK